MNRCDKRARRCGKIQAFLQYSRHSDTIMVIRARDHFRHRESRVFVRADQLNIGLLFEKTYDHIAQQ